MGNIIQKRIIATEEVDIDTIFLIELDMYVHGSKEEAYNSVREHLEYIGIDIEDMLKEFKDNIPYTLYEVMLRVSLDKNGRYKIIGVNNHEIK